MEDAIPMFHRLMKLTGERDLEFGVKLTNTFPVDVAAGELPSAEMYMSGRPLFPLTLSLASQLTHAFKGRLRISYSGGADIFSAEGLFGAGIWPITMATTVLKPGGYERFAQIGQALMGKGAPWSGVDAAAVDALLDAALAGVLLSVFRMDALLRDTAWASSAPAPRPSALDIPLGRGQLHIEYRKGAQHF